MSFAFSLQNQLRHSLASSRSSLYASFRKISSFNQISTSASVPSAFSTSSRNLTSNVVQRSRFYSIGGGSSSVWNRSVCKNQSYAQRGIDEFFEETPITETLVF
eukprot:Awhi_evm1s14248